MSYTLTAGETILRDVDGAFIPPDSANNDYVEYLKWLEEGNTPNPYVPPPSPELTPEQKLANAGLSIEDLKFLLGIK